MAWYDIPGVSCIFALDYNSVVSSDNSKIYLSNKPEDFLTSQNPSTIFKGNTIGWNVKDFKPISENKVLRDYKAIRFGSNLIFNAAKQFPNSLECTFILKVKLKTPSCFLTSNPNSNSFRGLIFSYYKHIWSFSGAPEGTISPVIQPADRFYAFSTLFETVVLKLNWGAREGSIQTSYGVFNLNIDSIFTSSDFFPKSLSFSMIGTPESTYNLNADIVAYGMFDKVLSPIQVETALDQIELEFLIREFQESIFYTPKIIKGNKVIAPSFYNTKNLLNIDLKFYYKSHMTDSLDTSKNIGFFAIVKPNFVESNINNKLKLVVENGTQQEEITTLLQYKNMFDLTGIVTEEDTPVSVKLFLYERFTGVLVTETYSNLEGVYIFRNLDKSNEYIVTAIDKKYQYKSIIQDFNSET